MLIEDVHVRHEFRTRSKEILTLLSRKDMTTDLCRYGDQDTGRKLLSIAAEMDWYEGVLFLLNRGVNINETDRENRTALIDCLISTNTNIITALVKKPECNLDIQTRTGHTAAHYAVMMNVRLSFCISRSRFLVHRKSHFLKF
jgi:ankyrin repeat protein